MFSLPDAAYTLPTPEVVPSKEKVMPEIGPNLATDDALCRKVIAFCVDEYWLSYELMQQRFWNLWRQLDEMWRAKVEVVDYDIPTKNYGQTMQDGTKPNPRDGFTQKISPTDMHKQWDVLLKMGLQISFDGGGLPVGGTLPSGVFETIYNPTEQTVMAFNEVLEETAVETDLKTEWRKNFHSFLVYGHCWAWTDLKRTFVDVDVRYVLGMDMQQVQMGLMQLQQKYRTQQARLEETPQGLVAIFKERRVDELYTSFKHLNKDDVFTDLLMPCSDMDLHPCPWVRQLVGEHALERNVYDPELNPFGWVNIEKAKEETASQYVLSQEDELVKVAQLRHRYNLSDQNILPPKRTIKQLWTAYPMLRIGPNGEFDDGKGIECPHCKGIGKMEAEMEFSESSLPPESAPVDCETCKGSGRVTIPATRYRAQFYGNPRSHGMTCLSLQKMPEGMRVPIRFAADMIEDTSCAIPACKGEVAMNDLYIKSEFEVLLLQSKRWAVLRGFKKKLDSSVNDADPFRPMGTVTFDTDPGEIERLEPNQIDEAVTIVPYIAQREERIKEILGATDQVVGELAAGRRSAAEITNAIDASRNPLVVMIDGYNRQMMGGWAEDTRLNLDLWADPDWIFQKTGRTYFGKIRWKTAVAEEFLRKMQRIQNERVMLEMLPNMLPVMPQLMDVTTEVLQRFFDDNGMGDIRIPDGGLLEAQQDGMQIVNLILGSGVLIPPQQDDPDDIFVRLFSSAIRRIQMGNDYWSGKSELTLPLLMARRDMQQQQLLMKQQAMLQQQIAMQNALNPPPEGGEGKSGRQAPAKKGPGGPPTAGNAIQSAQGPQGGLAA